MSRSYSTRPYIFSTTPNIYTTTGKTDYTCIRPSKDKHADGSSSVHDKKQIKDFAKDGKGGGQMVFHRPFTDIETCRDFIVRQAFLAAHPVDFASLGRHPINRTVDDRLQFADKKGFFFRLGGGGFLQVFVRIFFRNDETVEIVVHGKTGHLEKIGGERTDSLQFFTVFPQREKQILGHITADFLIVRQADKEIDQPGLILEKQMLESFHVSGGNFF